MAQRLGRLFGQFDLMAKLFVVTHNSSQSLGKKTGLSSERLNEQGKENEFMINK